MSRVIRLSHQILFLLLLATTVGDSWAQSRPYRIMIANDDGFDSPGVTALYDELASLPETEVMVVAPDKNYSGAGHWVMLRDPFTVIPIRRNGEVIGYNVNVPPASCVTIGIQALMDPKPDLVISGINRGSNAGLVTPSSGTVAGAREGAMNGITSIAVSLDRPKTRGVALDFQRAAVETRKIVETIRNAPLPKGVFLNVNLPGQDVDIKGTRITKQSLRDLGFRYVKQTSPFGRDLYWQTRSRDLTVAIEGTDEWALINGYISITPFTIDQTKEIDLPSLDNLVE
jgi:5'-nucleotidase